MYKLFIFSLLCFRMSFSFAQENNFLVGVEGIYYPKIQHFPATTTTPLRTKGLQIRLGYLYGERASVGILGNLQQYTLPQNADSIQINAKCLAIWQRNEAQIANLFNTFYEFQLGYKTLNLKERGGYFSVNGGLSAEVFPHVSLEIWASLLQYQLMWDAKKKVHKDFSLGGLIGAGLVARF